MLDNGGTAMRIFLPLIMAFAKNIKGIAKSAAAAQVVFKIIFIGRCMLATENVEYSEYNKIGSPKNGWIKQVAMDMGRDNS